MATLRDALRQHLEADAALMALLTGGILDASELTQKGASPFNVQYETDGVTLKPFAVIRWRGTQPKDIVPGGERRFFEVYFYQDTGYSVIESAKSRVKTLLDKVQIANVTDVQVAAFRWQQDTGEVPAAELGNAACEMSRYTIDYLRLGV